MHPPFIFISSLQELRLLNRHVHDLFLGEVGFAEVVFQVGHLYDMLVGTRLVLQFTALETEEAVGIAVALLLGDVLAAYLEQVFERHHGTAHGKIEESFLLLAAAMAEGYILQSYALRHLGSHAYLLTDAVDQVEVHLGEHDGQGDTGKATACANVENLRAWGEAYHLGYAQRVKHVVLIEVLDILA